MAKLCIATKEVIWKFIFGPSPSRCTTKEIGTCKRFLEKFVEDEFGWQGYDDSSAVFESGLWNILCDVQDDLCRVCAKELQRSKDAWLQGV